MIDRRDGLPHVTDILMDAGLIETEWFRQFDLDRGKAVHEATELLDKGDLDWDSVDPLIIGRVRQYQTFKDDVRPIILAIEEPVTNEALQYQGKLDRRLCINGREGVLDIKGPSRAAWHALQTMYYVACFPRPLKRWTLYLSDESYRLVESAGRNDWEACKAILTLLAWRRANDRTFVPSVRQEVPDRKSATQV